MDTRKLSIFNKKKDNSNFAWETWNVITKMLEVYEQSCMILQIFLIFWMITILLLSLKRGWVPIFWVPSLKLDNFHIFRNDRNFNNSDHSNSPERGVLFAVNKKYRSYELNYAIEAEHLFIHVIDGDSLDIIICVCYFPPIHPSPKAFIKSHTASIENLDSCYPNAKWLHAALQWLQLTESWMA